jgi:hypothetical protein
MVFCRICGTGEVRRQEKQAMFWNAGEKEGFCVLKEGFHAFYQLAASRGAFDKTVEPKGGK